MASPDFSNLSEAVRQKWLDIVCWMKLLQQCISEGTPEVCGWALLTSAARCDDEWVQLFDLALRADKRTFGFPGCTAGPTWQCCSIP
jgi:hypothetical protein